MKKLHARGKELFLHHGGSSVLACKECHRELGDEEEMQNCGKSFSKEQVLRLMTSKNSGSSAL
jgi:hypothetical protein